MVVESDLPVEPDRLGNNRVFPGLQLRRFFLSRTKVDFCVFGKPMIDALVCKLEKRCELEGLGMMFGFKFVEFEFPFVESLRS